MIGTLNEMPVTIRIFNENSSELCELTYNNIFEFKGALNMFCYTFESFCDNSTKFNISCVEWYDISMNWDECEKVFNVNSIDELNEFIENNFENDEEGY